jgi:ligand-binding SRPBCC domain-containing protein
MKIHRLQNQLRLPRPREQIFEFFADPRNLERITPPWLGFKIVTRPDIQISQGTLLDYRLRLRGIPLHWQSEITVWDPPHRFVDRQTKGPYSLWVHEHTFIDADGGTLVQDHVAYAVPGGTLIQKLIVAPDLARIFAYRRETLRKLFAEGTSTGTHDHSAFRRLQETQH